MEEPRAHRLIGASMARIEDDVAEAWRRSAGERSLQDYLQP